MDPQSPVTLSRALWRRRPFLVARPRRRPRCTRRRLQSGYSGWLPHSDSRRRRDIADL